MFTGIVQTVGSVKQIAKDANGCKITLAVPANFLADSSAGDSICVQGVCLTIASLEKDQFVADVSNETLHCTTLGEKNKSDRVNLESALTLASKLGGHLVSGHVDGVGKIKEIKQDGDAIQLLVESPSELAKYIAQKGSICIDGISLTVNSVQECLFSVHIIPHTFANTTLSDVSIDANVNLEVDLIARYLERLQIGIN